MRIKRLIYAFSVLLLWVGGNASARPPAPGVITEVSKLVAADLPAHAGFGQSIALDGDTAVIGAPAAQGNVPRAGAALVYRYKGGEWQQQGRLTASDGRAAGNFGRAVAIDGELIVVGAGGAAYVFRHDPGALQWVEEAKLVSPPAGRGRFGWAVAVSGERIVVGAPYVTGSSKGFVHFFHHGGHGDWELEHSLETLSNPLGDHYGVTVDMDGETAVVGAPGWGQVFVYEHDGAGWRQSAEIRDPSWGSNRAFGQAVALHAGVLVIGAPADPERGNNAGAAYVVRQSGGDWLQEEKLIPPQTAPGARFGSSTGVAGGWVVIGAPESDSRMDIEKSGAVFLFRWQEGGWAFEAELNASDGADDDHLGTAVAVTENHVLGGAPRHDDGAEDAGAVYHMTLASAAPAAPPPMIDQVKATSVPGGAIISWRTDVPATGRVVFYPAGSPDLRRAVDRGGLLGEVHQIWVSGLRPAAEYAYQVESRTGVDRVATSTTSTFATTDCARIFWRPLLRR